MKARTDVVQDRTEWTMAKYCLASGQRLFLFLLEDVRLYQYVALFCAVVFGLGCAYSLLTPSGQGIASTSSTLKDVNFLDGLYFSVVTVSSLGYGDVHPMGVSKVLACLEVLFGLAMMGIMIARLTSRRLSYHVQRLFSSDARKRIEEFASRFQEVENGLKNAMKSLGQAYQKTPKNENSEQETGIALSQFRVAVLELDLGCAAFAEYLSYEVEQGDFFLLAPTDAILRIGRLVGDSFFVLGQLIIGLSTEARTEILDSANRQRITAAITSQKTTCTIVQRHAKETELVDCFREILRTCTKVPESIYSTPVRMAADEQPDQVLNATDEPEVTDRPLPEQNVPGAAQRT